jgi:hypothetical protein
MNFNLEQSIPLLQSTPSALNSLLRNLPTAWTETREGDGTWTVSDVVAHLAHCEATDWMPRARTILQFGSSKPFAPLNREAFLSSRLGKPLTALLDDFARLRSKNLAELLAMHLSPSELELHGTHPVFGPVTLSQLLATWTAHDLTHLHQISRIMAAQYREAVGPWSEYLGVLQCNGHSTS